MDYNLENLLTEAVKSFLDSDAKMGLKSVAADAEHLNKQESGSKYIHQHVNDEFEVAISSLDFYEVIRSAFNKIHSFNYLEDRNFMELFMNEMKSRAVPTEEMNKAAKAVIKIMKKMDDERGAGWHPDIKGIKEVSQPKLYEN